LWYDLISSVTKRAGRVKRSCFFSKTNATFTRPPADPRSSNSVTRYFFDPFRRPRI
jgi:hypothetical protein